MESKKDSSSKNKFKKRSYNHGNRDEWRRARGRVLKLQSYYNHIVWYFLINGAMVVFNLYTSPERIWFHYPLIGWGIGLLSHTLSVYNIQLFFGKKWVNKKIKKRIEKSKATNL